jgi:hypothetical protein
MEKTTDGSAREDAARRRATGRRRILGVGLAALALAATIGGGIAAASEETVETRSVALDGASRAAVELDMDFGDLAVRAETAGSANLMVAEFAFDEEDWRPSVEYAVAGDEGRLKVGQPGDGGDLDLGDIDDVFQNEGNRWEVALSPDVPVDLAIDLDSGAADLDLGGLNLSGLDVDQEVGELRLDLSGVAPSQDVDASVRVEAGDVEVVVPAGVGVRIDADTGAGDVDAEGFERDGDAYVNAAYGEAEVTIRIEVDAAVGEVDLKVAGAE